MDLASFFKKLFLFNHITLDVNTHESIGGVRTNTDRLLEVARELAFTVVDHLEFASLARSNGLLGEGRDCATARSESLVNHERLIACVRKLEDIGLGLVFREFTIIVSSSFEFDDSLSAEHHSAEHECAEHCRYFLKHSFLND